MKFYEIEVFINKRNNITLKQGDSVDPIWNNIIVITADQADIVADEIKKLAKQLQEE